MKVNSEPEHNEKQTTQLEDPDTISFIGKGDGSVSMSSNVIGALTTNPKNYIMVPTHEELKDESSPYDKLG